jgi:hypothetical protein
MNTTTALFKKEFHTAKWVLLGGILFFWSFPLLQLAGNYYQWGKLQADMPSPMVIVFGGLFAIIAAAGLVCLDMNKGLYEFWRSKPIGLMPQMLVKYAVGLAIVLFVITMPVLLEIVLSEYDSPNIEQKTVLYCHTFIVILIYSIAFCIGHVLRNMTESVIISCAAALLIYFVPILVPALEPFSFFNLLFLRPPPSFYELLVRGEFINLRILIGMTIILSAGLFCAARICLGRHIQIRLGLKTMCWCLGLVSLVLFLAAAFSVASNLKCLAKISLPAEDEGVSPINFCFDNKGGVVLCGRYNESESPRYSKLQIDRISEGPSYTYRHESYPLETPLPSQGLYYDSWRIAWSKQAPDIVYFLGINNSAQSSNTLRRFSLYVIRLDDDTHIARVLGELPVGEYDAEKYKYYSENIALDYPTLYLWLPNEVAVVDVSDDKQPRLLAKSAHLVGFSSGENGKTFSLPSDKTLSEEQWRRIMQHFSYEFRARAWDGDRYGEGGYDSICVYEKKETGTEKIRLGKIAERKLPPLEKLIYRGVRRLILHDDIVYSLCNISSLMVYRLNESSGVLKPIGHYAAPEGEFYDMILRDDGRIALIGEKQIHIVQPPAIKSR